MKDQFLHHLIHEELFLVPQQGPQIENIVEEPTAKEEMVSRPETSEPTEKVIHELAIWSPLLTQEDRQLLVNILKAIGKGLDSVHLMEGVNQYQPNFKTLLCFGYQKELELKIGQATELYQPTQQGQQLFLVAAAPESMHANKEEKGRLWSALQAMFL